MNALFGDRQDWDDFAVRCLLNENYGRTQERTPANILKFLRDNSGITGGRLLDCGCNIGRWCDYFSKNGFECVGVDASLVAITIAKNIHGHMHFINDFIWNVNFENEFDVAISITALQHNFKEEQVRCLQAIKKALKPMGLFLMIEETGNVDGGTTHTKEGWIDLIFENTGKSLIANYFNWYLFK